MPAKKTKKIHSFDELEEQFGLRPDKDEPGVLPKGASLRQTPEAFGSELADESYQLLKKRLSSSI